MEEGDGMGNEQARASSRPKERGREAVCDRFDLLVSYDHPSLRIMILTDLPVGTRVGIAASRLFRDSDGGNWVWSMLDMTQKVVSLGTDANGLELERSHDHLDANGVSSYRGLRRSMGIAISGHPSGEVIVAVSAPAAKHHFGLGNRKLSGSAVSVYPSGHRIDRGVRLPIPLSLAAMQAIGMPLTAPQPQRGTVVGVPLKDADELAARIATQTIRRN